MDVQYNQKTNTNYVMLYKYEKMSQVYRKYGLEKHLKKFQ